MGASSSKAKKKPEAELNGAAVAAWLTSTCVHGIDYDFVHGI